MSFELRGMAPLVITSHDGSGNAAAETRVENGADVAVNERNSADLGRMNGD